MREVSSSYTEPPPPPPPAPPHPPKSNLPMLYYGLVVVGTTAIVLALYNIIIIKLCSRRQQSHQQGQRPNRFVEAATASPDQSLENRNRRNLLSSFKYKKDTNISTGGQEQEQEQGREHECAVCLSVFEDGEEVRQLPICKHSFHAPCIDMWFYSHSDCPLCRATVDVTRYNSYRNMNRMVNSQEQSREILLT